jgi:phenylalanine-4-hydroxylase
MRPTKGTADTAGKHYLARSKFQQMFMDRIDQLEMPALAASARRAIIEAFEAGAGWQRRHVKGEGE